MSDRTTSAARSIAAASVMPTPSRSARNGRSGTRRAERSDARWHARHHERCEAASPVSRDRPARRRHQRHVPHSSSDASSARMSAARRGCQSSRCRSWPMIRRRVAPPSATGRYGGWHDGAPQAGDAGRGRRSCDLAERRRQHRGAARDPHRRRFALSDDANAGRRFRPGRRVPHHGRHHRNATEISSMRMCPDAAAATGELNIVEVTLTPAQRPARSPRGPST